jgi:hypothetical protein
LLKVAKIACSNLTLFGPSGGRWDIKEHLDAFHAKKKWILVAIMKLKMLVSEEAQDPEALFGNFIEECQAFFERELMHDGEYIKYRCGSEGCTMLF